MICSIYLCCPGPALTKKEQQGRKGKKGQKGLLRGKDERSKEEGRVIEVEMEGESEEAKDHEGPREQREKIERNFRSEGHWSD